MISRHKDVYESKFNEFGMKILLSELFLNAIPNENIEAC